MGGWEDQDSPYGDYVRRCIDTLEPMGYKFEARSDGSGHYVSRMDDSPWQRRFKAGLDNFMGALSSSPVWRLDLTYGGVDYDRETLTVTPRDGGPAFSATHFWINGYSGDGPLEDNPAKATELFLTNAGMELLSVDQLPFRGKWHKWI